MNGVYDVSEDGQVRRRIKGGYRMLHPFVYNQNYGRIACMSAGGQQRQLRVAYLVALAFVPNPQLFRYVEHIDGNALNDHYTNLRWTRVRHPRFQQAEVTPEDLKPKRCPRCGETKPLHLFNRDVHSPDGRQCYCRACANQYAQAWFQLRKYMMGLAHNEE